MLDTMDASSMLYRLEMEGMTHDNLVLQNSYITDRGLIRIQERLHVAPSAVGHFWKYAILPDENVATFVISFIAYMLQVCVLKTAGESCSR